jgi:glucosamine--fructose-6-phosphate aminotransferase (isomerizing)
MALIAEATGALLWDDDGWAGLPQAVGDVLADTAPVDAAAAGVDGVTGLLVSGRGFLLATALEAALKLKECAGLLAQGYSSADLRHGPIAIVERDFPVIVLSSHGSTAGDTAELVRDLRQRHATVLEIGQRAGADVSVPSAVPEGLAPIVSAVRCQQLALAAARRRSLDPDTPEGLSKITETR